MASKELKKIVNKLNDQGKMGFIEAAKLEDIAEFEKANEIKLPEKFKEWLLLSDGGELYMPAGVQLYGVRHKPLIDVTDNSRPSNDYIVIGAFASGDPILFKKDEETIVIYNQEIDEIDDDLVFYSFESFLNEVHDLLGLGE